MSYFRILTIRLLLVYFVSAAGCHCFDLENSNEHSSIWNCFTEIQCCTLLYFWYSWFVTYCQNRMVCDSLSITGMEHHDQWCQLHWYFSSVLTGVIRNFSACLSKFGSFIRNWPACFEKTSFLYAGSYCKSQICIFVLSNRNTTMLQNSTYWSWMRFSLNLCVWKTYLYSLQLLYMLNGTDLRSSHKKLSKNQAEMFLILREHFSIKTGKFLKVVSGLFCGFLLYFSKVWFAQYCKRHQW